MGITAAAATSKLLVNANLRADPCDGNSTQEIHDVALERLLINRIQTAVIGDIFL